MADLTKVYGSLSLSELQQAQTLLSHELDQRREQERERLFEEFAALARARGIALQEVVQRARRRAAPAKRSATKRIRRPAPIKFRHPDQEDLTWSGRGKTPTWVSTWLKKGGAMTDLAV